MNSSDIDFIWRHIEQLRGSASALEKRFKRSFTLDGHLVGSIGEIVAAYMFDLVLAPHSKKGHDATDPSGRHVEVKLTQGKSIALRESPQHLVVLSMSESGFDVAYNGPGHLVWERCGKQNKRNGQRTVSVKTLYQLSSRVGDSERITLARRWAPPSNDSAPTTSRKTKEHEPYEARIQRNRLAPINGPVEPDPNGAKIRRVGVINEE
jgi:hypothetical protein